MIPVEVKGICLKDDGQSSRGKFVTLTPEDRTYVMLKDAVKKRGLDIQVGHFDAFAISSGLEGQQWKRPMTHDLLGQVIAALGATLRQVLITEHREDIFFAEMELTDRGGAPVTVSARPSDAIALALRLNVPILVSETLLADAA